MQIKILTIDVRLSENTKRTIRWVLLPVAVLMGSIAAAHAWSTSWITTGAPISASTLQATLNDGLVLPGTVVAFAGPAVPSGYLLCDGSAKSRTTYPALFAAIGTVSGNGDGASTFNLPDYQGRFLRGVSGSTGRDPDTASRTAAVAGGNTGNSVGSVQDDQFASHNHMFQFYSGAVGGSSPEPNEGNWSGGTLTTTILPVTSAGGSETRPKNASVNFVIKF